MFDDYLRRWRLIPDGDPIVTRGARLLPVHQGGGAAMLKVSTEAEEKRGAALMSWWQGRGAARVLAADADAVLLERATGQRSLVAMARGGRDDAATSIICDAIAVLHAHPAEAPPIVVPLQVWFRDLAPAAATHGGMLRAAAEVAHRLLSDPRDIVVLHGDIHHDKILDFGERGWLAIDPKGLIGERGFDYADLFCNPDIGDASCDVATSPERFAARLRIAACRSGIEPRRLLQWIVAWCGLSAAWFIGDGVDPTVDLRIAALARAELNRTI